MSETRVIRVYTPDDSMFADISNIPATCTAKELVETIKNLEEFAKYEKDFKIKCETGYLADDDVINDKIIHLCFAEEAIPVVKKQQKIMIKCVFWGLQFISLALIYFHKALYGIALYVVGSLILWWLKQLNPENDNLAADIIDGIRLFFTSLSPTFHLEDAAKKQQ